MMNNLKQRSSFRGSGRRSLGLDLEYVKSLPLSSTITCSATSSPSSTFSQTNNVKSTRTIMSTKKPRTPRKRPNQTYNEAATLLSTAYPNLFKKPTKPTTETNFFLNESSQIVLLPFRPYHTTSSFILQPVQHKPSFGFQTEPNSTVLNMQQKLLCQEVMKPHDLDDEDFDCESMLEEEMDKGIDSIMGSSRVEEYSNGGDYCERGNPCFGFRTEVKALRHVDDGNGNLWNFPAVDIIEISPGTKNPPATERRKKKKRKKRVEKLNVEMKVNSIRKLNQSLMLKLNYNEVRDAWSEQGSPFAKRRCAGK